MVLLSAGTGRLNLAGGGALIVHGLVDRPTDDLDSFTTATGEDFAGVVAAAESSFRLLGYEVAPDPNSMDNAEIRTWLVRERKTSRFGRDPEIVKVQICRDTIWQDPVQTRVGPALTPMELAANKILTIQDRPRHRDFDDVARLAPRLGLGNMIALAEEKQFIAVSRGDLANAIRAIRILDDARFPVPDRAQDLKAYFADVASLLENGDDLSIPSPYDPAWVPPQISRRSSDPVQDALAAMRTELQSRKSERER